MSTKRLFLQTSLKAGLDVHDYKEPNHCIGEAVWPGPQKPTRQLSLLDTVRRTRVGVVDLTPSPETSPRPKRRTSSSDET